MQSGGKYDGSFDRNNYKSIPLPRVVKLQSLIRGFLARLKVKSVYGYEMSRGLLMRGTMNAPMDRERLEEQKARVLAIRAQLPEFEYGLY
jgi:hypothetical protein